MLIFKPLSFVTIALPLALFTGCSNSTAGDHPDMRADAGDPSPDAEAPPAVVVTPANPLGAACSANAECASGFCTDGVCCDSACGQTCYSCAQQAAMGHCAALTSGQDPNAASPCVGTSACFVPPTGPVPACKSIDGTACQTDADCVSGHCLTYYADADGDGYGGSDQAHFCEELNAPPPAGYAAYAGDCCDLDSGANPAFSSSQFLQMPDACGSFDWNCDGVVTMQNPTCPGWTIQCGQPCYFSWGGSPDTSEPPLFVEACH